MHGNTVVEAGRGALSMVTVACRAFGGAIVRFKRETLKQRLQVAIQSVKYSDVAEEGIGLRYGASRRSSPYYKVVEQDEYGYRNCKRWRWEHCKHP